MDKDLEEHGVQLEAMNDTGNSIGDGVQDDFAEWEREQITERTTAGRREKARQGKIIAGRLPDYGFRLGPDRDSYKVVKEEMAVVRRIFSELAAGTSVNGVRAALDADGVPPPAKGKNKWQQRTFVRDCAFDNVYAPHTVEELEALGVSPEVLGKLDPAGLYGVWWYNRREAKTVRIPLGGGRYRKGKQIRKKPKHEWIPVPVPASGVPREDLLRARERLEGQTSAPPDARLGALRERTALPGLRADARCGLRVEGLHEEGRDPQEALPLRLCHSTPEREGSLLLREDPERPQGRGRSVGGGQGGLDPERLERGLDAFLEAEKEKAGGTPRKRRGSSRTASPRLTARGLPIRIWWPTAS
jgi:hypothetical protein